MIVFKLTKMRKRFTAQVVVVNNYCLCVRYNRFNYKEESIQ